GRQQHSVQEMWFECDAVDVREKRKPQFRGEKTKLERSRQTCCGLPAHRSGTKIRRQGRSAYPASRGSVRRQSGSARRKRRSFPLRLQDIEATSACLTQRRNAPESSPVAKTDHAGRASDKPQTIFYLRKSLARPALPPSRLRRFGAASPRREGVAPNPGL